MGYHDRDVPEPDPVLDRPRPGDGAVTLGVRLLGVALLLAGIFAGVSVFIEAWRLYAEPARIERFAEAVEAGSHIDRALAPPGAPATTLPDGTRAPPSDAVPLRLSYFLAWGIVLFLLLLITRLAAAAVRAGGELALADAQLRRFAQALVRESLRRERGPSGER